VRGWNRGHGGRLSFAADKGQKISIPRATRAHLFVYDSASMYRMDWTDDRLQERFDSIDRRFDEVDKRFEQVDKRFEQVDKRFDKVDHELVRINSRMDDLMRVMILTCGSIIATLIAGIVSLSVT
jgi:septal ring factor EnvC (AmiA/AmiB activator)